MVSSHAHVSSHNQLVHITSAPIMTHTAVYNASIASKTAGGHSLTALPGHRVGGIAGASDRCCIWSSPTAPVVVSTYIVVNRSGVMVDSGRSDTQPSEIRVITGWCISGGSHVGDTNQFDPQAGVPGGVLKSGGGLVSATRIGDRG